MIKIFEIPLILKIHKKANCYKFNNTDAITQNTRRYSLSSRDLLMSLLMNLLFKLWAISKVIYISIIR